MQSSAPQTIPCPHCQDPVDVNPVNVLREGMTTVDDLFAGTLNQVTCPHCKQPFIFETPLLYRDDPERYLAYYLPKSMVTSLDDALKHVDALYQETFAELDELDQPTCRLTVQRSQLIEKIALHRCGYDDRIVEYIKYMLFQHNEGLDPIRHQLLFDFGNSDADQLMFLAYNRESGQPDYALNFTADDYADLADQVFDSADMEGELDRLFRGYYVHVDDLLQDS